MVDGHRDSIIDEGDNTVIERSTTREVRTAASTVQSDAQWDAAQKLTAQAAEQSRIAQTRTMEATKFKQTADEARRAADKAHVKEHELEDKLGRMNLESIESRLADVTTRYNAAKRNIGDAKAALEQCQREADDAKEKVDELLAKQQGPAKEVEALMAKLDGLNQKLDEANKGALDSQASAKQHGPRAGTLEEQIAAIKKDMSKGEDRYEIVKDTIADLQRKLKAAIDEKEAIKDAYRANKSELSGLESVLASLRQEIETQVGTAKSSQSLADQLAAKKQKTQYDLAEAEKALDALKAQTVAAQKEAEAKLKELSLDQSALNKIKAEVATKGDDVKARQAALDKAHEKLDPLERELDELRKAAKGQEMRAEELTAKAMTVSEEADIAQAKKEELWHKAMKAGENADETSDRGYMAATKAAGLDTTLASQLLEKNEKTAEVSQRSATQTITTESSKKVTSSSHSSK